MLDPVHFPQFMTPRLGKTIARLQASVWSTDGTPLAVSAAAPSPDPVDASAAKRLKFSPVARLPHTWGRLFDQRWWKLRLPISKKPGVQRYLFWGDQAEATVYLDGSPVFGFDPGHHYCPLPADARELLIESTCCRTGVWVPGCNEPMSDRGSIFSGAHLAQRDDDAWHAHIDLQVLTEALVLIHLPDYPAESDPMSPFGYRPPIQQAPPIFRSVLRQINDAIDVYDRSGTPALRRALQGVYRSLAITNRSHTAVLTGHAHIDLAWLWPKRVAQAKAVHSFANALSVIERYPEVYFGYSQPASYRDTQKLSPKLMDRVRSCIRTGKWEATGTMEVESDTQLPCGEALVRSFELGRKGFLELNGKRRGPGRVVWLPDTFGYSACIPQIMAGFGVPYFFTTKIHWGSATRLPYTSFRWQGNDGSEVLAHIIQDHYNLEAKPGELQKIAMKHQQADIHPEVLCPTGYGDGGGGPNDAMAERVRRMGKLGLLGEAAGIPDTRWGRIDGFFDRLNKSRTALPTWRGEMYLQYHRGVQTTHADLKAAYRAAERALQVWEAVRCATGKGPIDESAWQTVAFNQFHDILPGSSIWEVCVQAVDELKAVADNAMDKARDELTRRGGKPCVFNPLAMPNYVVTDKAVSRIEPLTGSLRAELEPVPAETPKATPTSLQNARVSARFDKAGQVRSLTIDGKPIALTEPGAQLWSFPDHPATYDAWDIDRPTLSNGERIASPAIASIQSKGTLNAAVCFKRKLGPNSEAVIRYRLDPARPLLLIDMDIEWQEPQTLLKMAFPTGYTGQSARYGSPFGSTQRPQLPGPIENDAMFEAPASRWAAVADDTGGDGLALVTEAKYGFGCMNGLLHVSLLRTAMITQPTQGPPRRTMKGRRGALPTYSDLGRHKIQLAIGRYSTDAPREEQPAAWAETLFNQPIAYTGRPVSAGLRGIDAAPGLIPAWAKPLTNKRWVLRLHETLGQRGTCKIDTASTKELSRLDLNDESQGKVTRRGLRIEPYQIVSVGLSRE
jgi:alpha-mannosidase